MMNLISLLIMLVFCLGFTNAAMAQREVAPPTTTLLDASPVVSRTKTVASPVQAAKNTEKVKKTAKPAPVQAATIPNITAESKSSATACKPKKVKEPAKNAAAKSPTKKPATVKKDKKQKSVKICNTAPKSGQKVAKTNKNASKVAKKTTHKKVFRATTIPVD